VLGIVAVAPEHVRLDQVGEDDAVVELAQKLFGLRDAVDVRFGRMRFVDVLAGEDVADLADAVHFRARVPHEREVVRTPGLEREVMAVRSALVVPRLAGERPSDYASDGVLSREDLPRGTGVLVQLPERNRFPVRSDMQDP